MLQTFRMEARRLALSRPWLPWMLPAVAYALYNGLCMLLVCLASACQLFAFSPCNLIVFCLVQSALTLPMYHLPYIPPAVLWPVAAQHVALLHYLIGYVHRVSTPGSVVVVTFGGLDCTLMLYLVAQYITARDDPRRLIWGMCTVTMPLCVVPQAIVLLMLSPA